jgi:hypothetical protein
LSSQAAIMIFFMVHGGMSQVEALELVKQHPVATPEDMHEYGWIAALACRCNKSAPNSSLLHPLFSEWGAKLVESFWIPPTFCFHNRTCTLILPSVFCFRKIGRRTFAADLGFVHREASRKQNISNPTTCFWFCSCHYFAQSFGGAIAPGPAGDTHFHALSPE